MPRRKFRFFIGGVEETLLWKENRSCGVRERKVFILQILFQRISLKQSTYDPVAKHSNVTSSLLLTCLFFGPNITVP